MKIILKIVSILILFIVGYYSFDILIMLFKTFLSLNPNVIAALITASVGLIGLIYSQNRSQKREIFESHREQKIEVYNIFFNMVEKFQDQINHEDIDLDNDFKNEFKKLTRGLILWGSPAVIKAYIEFRNTATNSSTSSQVLSSVDKMYQAIRKDLGNSNFALKKFDLIRLNLSDTNEEIK